MPMQGKPGAAASRSACSQGRAQCRQKQQIMAGTEYISFPSGPELFIQWTFFLAERSGSFPAALDPEEQHGSTVRKSFAGCFGKLL